MFWRKRRITGILLDGHWGVVAEGRGNGRVVGVGRSAAPGVAPEDLAGFFDGLPPGNGRKAALSLPLGAFDVLLLSFPPVPEEAMAAAVGYQLSRNVEGKVEEYVYDWMENSRDPRAVEVTVYMLERSRFQAFDSMLQSHGYRLTYLEPDIFSAFAFLEAKMPECDSATGAVIGVLLWEDSISLGIKHGESLPVARSVALRQEEAVELAAEERSVAADTVDIFEEFGLAAEGRGKEGAVQIEDDPLAEQRRRYREYLDSVVLEVVRSRDYFVSVLKRGRIEGIVLGGPARVVGDLSTMLAGALDIPVHEFPEDVLGLPCTSAQAVAAAGSVMGR